MKICFIGLGSIGTRHLKNLIFLLKEKQIEHEIHALRSTEGILPNEISKLIDKEFKSIDVLAKDYDIVFITNPTALHYETACKISQKTKNIFIEKPVFHSENIDLSKINVPGIIYVACPLRYTKVIQFLKEILKKEKIYSARAVCSSYLPDWRPQIDYRDTYSAKKSLGGGVAIDLIHEWDYLTYLFGLPKKVKSMQGKYSHLKIDTEDIAVYLGEYEDMLVSLHLDYFGRVDKREIEIYTENDVILGDLIQNRVIKQKTGEIVEFFQERNEYQQSEIESFLEMIKGNVENDNSIEQAIEVLKITKGDYYRL